MKKLIELISINRREILFVIFIIFSLATAKTLKGQSVAEVQTEVAKYEITAEHQQIIVAQSILESGWYKSRWCTEFNNIFGLTKWDRQLKKRVPQVFPNWELCIKSYYNQIYKKYALYDGGYYDFLFDLPYATGDEYINKLKTIIKQVYE